MPLRNWQNCSWEEGEEHENASIWMLEIKWPVIQPNQISSKSQKFNSRRTSLLKKTFMKESSNSHMTSNIFSLRRVQPNSCEQTFDRHFTPIARGGENEKTGFIWSSWMRLREFFVSIVQGFLQRTQVNLLHCLSLTKTYISNQWYCSSNTIAYSKPTLYGKRWHGAPANQRARRNWHRRIRSTRSAARTRRPLSANNTWEKILLESSATSAVAASPPVGGSVRGKYGAPSSACVNCLEGQRRQRCQRRGRSRARLREFQSKNTQPRD